MYGLILTAHILAATLWTGGHLILAVGFLPEALRSGDIGLIQRFERRYEPIGLSALAVQLGSGLWLAHHYQPNVSLWLSLEGGTVPLIGLKLVLLALTVALALHARLQIIPRLSDHPNLPALAYHIVGVTVLSVLFVAVGIAFRAGTF